MGMKSIMNFFRPTEQRQPANADVSTLEAAKTNCESSKSQPKVRESATQNGSYITQTIQTDSQPNPNEISKVSQIPSDCNVEQKERVWTDAEKKKLDKFLTGWA